MEANLHYSKFIQNKIFNHDTISKQITQWKLKSQKIIFTNGCFDLLHDGHLTLLTECKQMGGKVVVGLNSDESVRLLKGPSRPIKNEQSRLYQLAALLATDAVIIFHEETPLELIKLIQPDILVKGGDYTIDNIVGASFIKSYGGEVCIVSTVEGFSTSGIIKKIEG